jgi:hypothetical protein
LTSREPASPSTATRADPLAAVNSMTANGLITNGLITNGLITNGLITNGLITNGMRTAGFSSWFNGNPTSYSEMVMFYVVACALDNAQSVTWSNPDTGATYTWTGVLGLAPVWASGLPIPLTEQQLVSACLAAHVNKYGLHVEVSVSGSTSAGLPIPTTAAELATFGAREACFFGNLFDGTGVFAANDRPALSQAESTVRACGLSSQAVGRSVECPPIEHVGTCAKHCVLDPSGAYYASCTYNGVTYKPLTTRIRSTDIYRCGDGVCQFTEKCGASALSSRYDDCGLDCGVCK